ncbi:MAG: antitoxin [Deferribacteres bacterium]|nr:antitoxin [Deferribacteres bacterium]
MSTMTIRGIDEEMAKILKETARKEGISVNATLLKILRESLGIEKKKRIVIHHDLDHLAGTWSEREHKEFQKRIAHFEKVDEEMWR